MTDRKITFSLLGNADGAVKAFQQVDSASSNLHVSLGHLATRVVAGSAIYQGFSAATSFAKNAIFGFNSTLQQSQIAFTTMLGSAQKAKDFIGQLQAFAKATPFDFQGLVQNSQSLLGMGVAANDILPDLKALGDSVASVGGGADVLNNTISAFGQTMAKGTLDMGNMNQLLQGGVPTALKVLAAQYHVTTGEMVKMISSGKVQSSQALPLLVKGLEQGTSATAGLGGMMDKQSQTFQGALSNIGDSMTQILAKVFKPFFDYASKALQSFANWLSSPAAAEFGKRVSTAFSEVSGVVMPALRQIGDLISTYVFPAFQQLWSFLTADVIPVFQAIVGFVMQHKTLFESLAISIGAMIGVWKAYQVIMLVVNGVSKTFAAVQALVNAVLDANPIGLVVLALAGLAAGFVFAYKHSETFRDIVQGVFRAVSTAFQWIVDAAKTAFDWLIDHWKIIVAVVFGPWGLALDAIVTHWHTLRDGVMAVWNFLSDNVFKPLISVVRDGIGLEVSALKETFKTTWRAIQDTVSTVWDVIKPILETMKRAIDDTVGAVGKVASVAGGIAGKAGGVAGKVGHFFGFAGGTDYAPGGWSWVGEQGPELMYVPRGAQVVPNGMARRMAVAGGGGGVQLVVVQQGNYIGSDKASARAMAAHIHDALQELVQRNARRNGFTGFAGVGY